MKRFISVFLAVSMVLSMASTAFAADSNVTDPNSLPNTYTEKLEDGDIFIQQSDWQTVVILTSDKDHIINIAIKYFDTPDMVYQWVLTTIQFLPFSLMTFLSGLT